MLVVMKLCSGSLRNLMEKKKIFSAEEMFNLIVQVTNGMCILSAQGMMHLDLKPDNILYCG